MNPVDSIATCFSPGRESMKVGRSVVGNLFSVRRVPDGSKMASWDSLSCTSAPIYNSAGWVISFDLVRRTFKGSHRTQITTLASMNSLSVSLSCHDKEPDEHG